MTTQQESRQAAEDSEIAEIRRIGETAQARRLSRAFMQTADDLPRLFDLAAEDAVLLADLTLAYGQEVDPDDAEAVERKDEAVARLAAQFVGNDEMIIRKVERYIHVIESQTMMVESFKARAKRLSRHAAAIENGQTALKQRLIQAMHVMGRDIVSTPAGVVTIRQNPVSVTVLNEPVVAHVEAYETRPDVPAEFVRLITLWKVDKRALAAWIKATGEVVDGVSTSRSERIEVR